MTALRSAASALLILGLTLSAFFVVPPTPANAEESGAGLSATVFAFDFSGSIFCYDGGKPNPSCKNPINESLSEAVNALAAEISTNASKYAARKIDFNVTRFGSASKGSVFVCKGNTATQVDHLVSCLRNVAQLYLKPSNELGGTAFSPEIQVLSDYAGQRCGLILFTDGTPDDKDKALALADSSNCAILPVSTGPGDINQEYLQKITSTELDTIPGCTDRQFSWTTVYFESAAAATQAIGTALDEVACLLRIPGPDCMAVSQYQTTLENLGLQVVLGTGVGTSQFPSVSEIAPIPGTRVDKGSTVTLGAGTDAAPAQCVPTPPPTDPPPPPPPPPAACVADGPLSWLGCNPWWLLLLLGLVLARLWWVGRDLQVSINGQEAVGLRGGRLVGFDVHGGTASRVSNPNQAEVKISRSFFRFLPSTRISAASLGGSVVNGTEKFRIGQPVDLTSELTARFAYGNPRPVSYSSASSDEPTDFSGTSSSDSGSISSAL